jgi:hypothetical protein
MRPLFIFSNVYRSIQCTTVCRTFLKKICKHKKKSVKLLKIHMIFKWQKHILNGKISVTQFKRATTSTKKWTRVLGCSNSTCNRVLTHQHYCGMTTRSINPVRSHHRHDYSAILDWGALFMDDKIICEHNQTNFTKTLTVIILIFHSCLDWFSLLEQIKCSY